MFNEGVKSFIERLRDLDERLARLRLCNVEIDKQNKEIEYNFICDEVVSVELQNTIVDFCSENTPEVFSSVNVKIKKIVGDKELVSERIYRIISENNPSLTFDFNKTDIEVETFGKEIHYTLNMIPSSVAYCKKNGTLFKINKQLERFFCDDFVGKLSEKSPTLSTELNATTVSLESLQTVQKRLITVSDVVVIDDYEKPEIAVYIADAIDIGEVTLCGRITSIKEKTASNGKPFYIFDFEDGTGKTGGIYFTKKTTVEKIKALKEGDSIIIRGKIDNYKDKTSLTINKINLCKLPENFVPEERKGKCVPLEYRLIKPQPAESIKETTLFTKEEKLPKCLTENTFVVFDIETTGTESTDEITEIGAVKIVNGKVCESFQTLVKPNKEISQFITDLTGIDNEMVKDAPSIKDVIPDFFKFTFGSILVGQNILDFDIKFIRRAAEPLDYRFDNKIIDTLILAREVLPTLKNHKLNTLADHFGVVFSHHRALSDSFATAEVFTELVKIKKSF